ncbi:hypothetical protein [Bosea massiliensis]|uniref:DUF5872 domain-containing protein n=1 Tax=Bosea massiliensis TaxID=151419 RepID=A0ABW0P3F2_9HYPH
MTTATDTAVVATQTKTYDRPYLPRGQYFAMLREQGLLKPREPKAASEKPATSKKTSKTTGTDKAAARAAFAKRRHFANRAKAAKDPNAPVVEKKVYDTPYVTRGQWFKMMRESGQLAPRQPKTAPVGETVVETVVETAAA